jgi:hypothetical protein
MTDRVSARGFRWEKDPAKTLGTVERSPSGYSDGGNPCRLVAVNGGADELSDEPRSLTAGELACHPVAITALAVLVVNDRWLKFAWPGFVTGKLSDCAGLVLVPIAFLSVTELLRRIFRKPVTWRYDPFVWVALSVTGFVFVKVTPAGNDAYAWMIGAIRWAAQTLLYGSGPIRPVLVSRDRTDLLALAVSALPFLLIRNRTRAARAASLAAEHPTTDTPARSRWLAQTGR